MTVDAHRLIRLINILRTLPYSHLLWLALELKLIEFVNYKTRTPTFRIRPRHRDNPSTKQLIARILFGRAAKAATGFRSKIMPDGRKLSPAAIAVKYAFEKYWNELKRKYEVPKITKEEKIRRSALRALVRILPKLVRTSPPEYRPLIYRLALKVLKPQSHPQSK